ncbi:heme A synthase [Psychrobium sp. 1_MG-2023]|uniref:COX15/CtaA family protein n=1 Tax=Psychrobium sp. 1_MG-2023 TaxID=3062624 RepID=UPI000C349869|nr:COX15/CtaA family protein [Psychrobium sp. 1_MG-2023]MDP2561825.1 COX15/CtaA family protein [Psychrobium sp. 1_MG-2023]PKF55802.1 cytochrome B [Alteromonadales bacterium alter-6D02]
MQQKNKSSSNLSRLVLIATLFSLFVIALGAYTRLVHAGLGCPDWPLCYGHLWAPVESADIIKANLAFPDAPVDLSITWPEMTHRYLATSLGLFCIAIVLLCYREKKRIGQAPLKHSVLLLFFIILQGLFGMWTVTLKLWPQVVTTHLLGGFFTFSLLLLLWLRLNKRVIISGESNVVRGKHKTLCWLALAALLITLFQIGLGGWTTSNYAALACTQLPWCDLSHLDSNDFSQAFNVFQQVGPNYLGGQLDAGARIAIHISHRIGAVLVTIVIGILLISLVRARYYRLVLGLAGLLFIQLSLGLANVYFYLPLFNAVAHNVMGAILFGGLVGTNYYLWSKAAGEELKR